MTDMWLPIDAGIFFAVLWIATRWDRWMQTPEERQRSDDWYSEGRPRW